jgi:hypothetical protein
MSDTELHDRLVEVANQAVPTDLLPRVHSGIRARKRRRGAVAVGSTVAAVAAVAVVATQAGGSAPSHAASHAAGQHHQHPDVGKRPSVHKVGTAKRRVVTAPAVKLVTYTGTQPAGYSVDKVPAGWFIGGVSPFTLTIDPPGYPNPDPNPDSFVGKLIVSLEPSGDNLRTDGPKHGGIDVTVNGRDGLIELPSAADQGESALAFYDAAGNVVDVEVPPALGWTTAAPYVAFAEGVHVLTAAAPTFG